jgi:hypothetical protein
VTLRDDLIAARGLIDTPEKHDHLRHTTGSALAAAFYGVAGPDEERVNVMFKAFMDVWKPLAVHAELMAMFDAAIAAAEQVPS